MSYRDTIATIMGLVKDSLDYASVVPYIDFLGADAPSASVQRLAGVRWTERYLDGGGEGELPFAVLLRVPNKDSKTRIDASGALADVVDSLEGYDDGTISSIRGEDDPTKVAADDGSETWRVQLTAVVNRVGYTVS